MSTNVMCVHTEFILNQNKSGKNLKWNFLVRNKTDNILNIEKWDFSSLVSY